MDITQTFYDNLAPHYDKLFADWDADSAAQADLLSGLFEGRGFDISASVLDCACGIGTQAIGLARLGYRLSACDISRGALNEAEARAAARNLSLCFKAADFRALSAAFSERFSIVIAMDNALPHMLTQEDLRRAAASIADRVETGGIFVGSIRDYDALLETKPPYSPPYIHKTDKGQRVAFQTWDWQGERYLLTQYIIEDGDGLAVSKFTCEYRATRRDELTDLFKACGFSRVDWLFPAETGFYQPIFIAHK